MSFTVTNLTCQRGSIPVLEGVSFSLQPGTALVLRGPNGSGKTTLLRCLAGLTPPHAGEIGFDPDEIAYSGHSDGVKAQLSVEENLVFWAAVYGTRDIAAAVDTFDLAPLLSRPAQFLSAGQRRRVSLSRMTLTNRPIWALDEPTVSLDGENTARFAAAVNRHLDAGGAAIIATHIELGLSQVDTLELAPLKARLDHGIDPFLDGALT